MNSHIHISRKGFTLIEFMVTITIFFIIATASYIPYSHYQRKWLLNQWVKEITQSLYEARNMSINGLNSGSGNVSVWLYFDTSDAGKNQITYFSYPHSFTGSQITNVETSDILIERVKTLPGGIWIDSVSEKASFLVFFQAITWKWSYYFWDTPLGAKQEFTWDILDIDVSFKGATSESLQKQIEYYTEGNIADY